MPSRCAAFLLTQYAALQTALHPVFAPSLHSSRKGPDLLRYQCPSAVARPVKLFHAWWGHHSDVSPAAVLHQQGNSPSLVHGNTEEQPVLPVDGEVFVLRKLLPPTSDYDFNVHVMDFEPGERWLRTYRLRGIVVMILKVWGAKHSNTYSSCIGIHIEMCIVGTLYGWRVPRMCDGA